MKPHQTPALESDDLCLILIRGFLTTNSCCNSGVIFVLQAVGTVMKGQHSGVIVNIGSVSATFTRPFAGVFPSLVNAGS